MKHPQTLQFKDGVMHIRYLEASKKEGNVKTRLGDVYQEIFECKGMVVRGLEADQSMISELVHAH